MEKTPQSTVHSQDGAVLVGLGAPEAAIVEFKDAIQALRFISQLDERWQPITFTPEARSFFADALPMTEVGNAQD